MKALVTGASGFLGSAVTRQLLSAGHEVRVLVRASSNRKALEGLEIEECLGDLRDPDSLQRATRQCDAVFHVAAEYKLWHPRPKEMYDSNVEGTRNVLRACDEAGVGRVVYTSSVATLGLRTDGEPGDEETPVSIDDMQGHYKRSKYMAEEEAKRMGLERDIDLVIVNPTAPIGPGDVRPTPTGRMVLDAAAGRMPAYVDTGLNVAHVDDVARGHLLAHERGRRGERYVLGSENMTLAQILTLVAHIVGRRPPRIRLSPTLLLPVGYAAQLWARVSGSGEPRVTVDGLRLSRKRMFFTDGKARRELGYDSRPAEAAIRDAIDWFWREGYLSER